MSSPAKGRREVTDPAPRVNPGRLLSCGAVTLLALSRHVSFHARGDAVFAWHGLTGDVAEMSRDVLGLLLAFEPPADDAKASVPGLSKDQLQEFTSILRARRFLVQAGAGGQRRLRPQSGGRSGPRRASAPLLPLPACPPPPAQASCPAPRYST